MNKQKVDKSWEKEFDPACMWIFKMREEDEKIIFGKKD